MSSLSCVRYTLFGIFVFVLGGLRLPLVLLIENIYVNFGCMMVVDMRVRVMMVHVVVNLTDSAAIAVHPVYDVGVLHAELGLGIVRSGMLVGGGAPRHHLGSLLQLL